MCLPLVGGIAAVLLGVIALLDIKASHGRKGGTAVALLGLLIGGGTSAAYLALTAWLLLSPSLSPTASPRGRPPAFVPTGPGPTGAPPPTAGALTMSVEANTMQTVVGKLTVVDVGLGEKALETVLRAQQAQAAAKGQTLVMQTTGDDCRPCLGVGASLVDAKMQRALDGVRLVRVNAVEFHEELDLLGIPHELIPGFFLLDADLAPTDGVNGGEWDDDEAANIAPVLEAFVRGKALRRRYPWKAPRPQGTVL
jgi:hypothetical protein